MFIVKQYLKWRKRRQEISFKKSLARMHWIQELITLPQYKKEKLAWLPYWRIRKMFIKEFPNAYLHNPHTDK